MNKKYELIDSGIANYYRIRALRDVNDNVKKGDLGGLVQSEKNLSHDGTCWIYDDAISRDNAVVKDNAGLFNHSSALDNSIIQKNAILGDYACVKGHSIISDSAYIANHVEVCDHSMVFDRAIVGGNCSIFGNAKIYGKAVIEGRCRIKDNASVCDAKLDGDVVLTFNAHVEGNIYIKEKCFIIFDANIRSYNDFLSVGPIFGSDKLFIYKDPKNGVIFSNQCGEIWDIDEIQSRATDEQTKYKITKIIEMTKYM